MYEVRMSLALWVAQNPELWRDRDDARNGFIAVIDTARKCRRRRALDEIGTGKAATSRHRNRRMANGLQSH